MKLYNQEVKPRVISFIFSTTFGIKNNFVSNQVTYMHIYMYEMAVDMSFSKGHNQWGTDSDFSATEPQRG